MITVTSTTGHKKLKSAGNSDKINFYFITSRKLTTKSLCDDTINNASTTTTTAFVISALR